MYISIINIISPRRRFYDLHGSGENNSCTSFTIHMATAILPSSTIFGTDFSVPTEGPMQAWQYPHQIAGSGGQAGIPRGDTISCTLGRQRSGPSIDVRFPRSISGRPRPPDGAAASRSRRRWVRDFGRATPSLRHAPSDTFSSRLTPLQILIVAPQPGDRLPCAS